MSFNPLHSNSAQNDDNIDQIINGENQAIIGNNLQPV